MDGLEALLKVFKFRTKNVHVALQVGGVFGTFILILFGCESVTQMELSGLAKVQFLSVNMAFDYAVTVGVYVIAMAALAVVDEKNSAAPVSLLVLLVGLAMGFHFRYPINPARDLAPSLFTAIAGWGLKVFRAGDH
ncbi:hypothetical protein NDU88_008153 [Pleurodeles waltl]|uniref:Uncharacterized protein n=1 Tax=Pleurodeles waltl TaxID=8319 RepID=A0AAV7NV76_PLEWA|nr:hypothetical protein NDU88_008153 [Pleurodeles waltl]